MTLVQKQVGQTRVQLVQARQRSAISAQRGLSAAAIEAGRQPFRRDRVTDPLAAAATAAPRGVDVGRRPAQPQAWRGTVAGPGPDADDEAVIELGQGEVEAGRDLGTGAHGRAEAGVGGRRRTRRR